MHTRTMTILVSSVLALLLALGLGLPGVATAQDPGDDPSDDSSDDPSDDSSDDPSDDPSDGASDDPTDAPTDSPPGVDRDVTGRRVFGEDRFSTAVAISQYEFPDGAAEVYLANAGGFADALAGGALSRGPILLVPACDVLPSVVAAEISRLAPDAVVALGGAAAICDDVLSAAIAAAAAGDDDGDADDDGIPDDDDDSLPATETVDRVDLAVGEQLSFDAAGAGTVTIARTEAGVALVEAIPAAGWSIRPSDPADPGEAEVDFTDGQTRVDVSAELEDGGLVQIEIRTRAE